MLRISVMATGSETESDISQLRTQLTIARNEIHNLRCETVWLLLVRISVDIALNMLGYGFYWHFDFSIRWMNLYCSTVHTCSFCIPTRIFAEIPYTLKYRIHSGSAIALRLSMALWLCSFQSRDTNCIVHFTDRSVCGWWVRIMAFSFVFLIAFQGEKSSLL